MIARPEELRIGNINVRLALTAGSLGLLALLIRIIGLGAESAWIDEAYSITLARYPVAQILQGTAADQHPPLYYIILHAWMLARAGVTHARLLSAVIGTLHVLQVFFLGRKINGDWLGIAAALFLAVSPFHIWYSQEARQYILLASLTTAATSALWDCLHGRRRWVLYGVLVTLSLYTQYFSVFVLPAHGLITVLWAWKQRRWKLLMVWTTAVFGVVIAFLPWLSIALDQFQNHGMPWISEPEAGEVVDVMLRMLLGSGVLALPGWMHWIGLIILIVAVGWIIERLWERKWAGWRALGFLGIWAMVPYSAMSLAAVVYPIFQFKQYLICLAPILMTAVSGAMALPRLWKWLIVSGLILVNIITSGYQQTVLSKDDWRGAATYMQAEYQASDLVYGNPAASSLALELYWPGTFQFSGYPPDYNILRGGWSGQPLSPALVDQQLSGLAHRYRRLWLVEFFPQFWDADKNLESWLEEHGTLREDSVFGQVRLRLYDLEP